MDVFRVRGGSDGSLHGSVQVSGAKNAALPVFAAALLTDEPVTLRNVPDLSDLRFMAEILRHLGAEVERPDPHTWVIHAKEVSYRAPYDLVRKMRASVCLLGPMVARLRRAEVSLPGGCVIGPRPVDLHLKGLAKLGCDIRIENGYIFLDARNSLRGAEVYLGGRHGSTVTGTANILMAATRTPGTTRIEWAACEPEVTDLCLMLQKMGARIEGVGSPTLTIHGVDQLHGCDHAIMPDRIEAGTYLVAGAITRSILTVQGITTSALGAVVDKLEECGIKVIHGNGQLTVDGTALPRRPVDLITHPFPGFPTDLQAQMCALMAVTPGLSIITERIYPNRFMHVPELQRMGADIAMEGPSAVIKGRDRLSGAPVMASDLRASAALVLAALAADGETWIQRIYHLDRGYEAFETKLAALGADIARCKDADMPKDIPVEA